MKNYNLIVTVLFKSGVERVYKTLTHKEVEEDLILDVIKNLSSSTDKAYINGEKTSLNIGDTFIDVSDTSAITFSYEEI